MQNHNTMPVEPGEDQKEQALWSVEILFRDAAAQHKTNRYGINNMSSANLMKLRTHLFTIGLMLPIDPGHWKLIAPFDLLSVDVYKQAKRF